MAKFDHAINLPKIFFDNKLAILPITRGDYIISHFDAYHKFEAVDAPILQASLPEYIQSLDVTNLPSEAIAVNCAAVTGIIASFLQDEDIVPTVSGRMGSGTFDFNIANVIYDTPLSIRVINSQIEIDAAFEGVHTLSLFEAKRDLSEDFLIRQLYYPFRTWESRVTKPVKSIFLIYSNGLYRIYEYMFEDIKNYNSLVLTNYKKYSIEDTTIKLEDIQNVLYSVTIVEEEEIPFPQADSFERVINICELLSEQTLTRDEITEKYAFDERQTNYYTDAARYLGLVEKQKNGIIPIYLLSEKCKNILKLKFKQRQLKYCECVLSHKVFSDVLKLYFDSGDMLSKEDIIRIMKRSNLYNIESDSTFERRSSTIRGWINWIVSLINE